MAVVHSSPIVRGVPSVVAKMPTGIQYTTVTLYNGSAASIFIGDTTVATSGAAKGLTVAAAGTLVINLNANDVLYGIAATATAAGEIVVLYSGI